MKQGIKLLGKIEARKKDSIEAIRRKRSRNKKQETRRKHTLGLFGDALG